MTKPNPRSGERGWSRPEGWAKPGPKPGSIRPDKAVGPCLDCGAPMTGKRSDRKYCNNRTCGARHRRRGSPDRHRREEGK